MRGCLSSSSSFTLTAHQAVAIWCGIYSRKSESESDTAPGRPTSVSAKHLHQGCRKRRCGTEQDAFWAASLTASVQACHEQAVPKAALLGYAA